MARTTVYYHLFFLLIAYLSCAFAASPTTFCKCTCFSNSTIIPLNSSPAADSGFLFARSSDPQLVEPLSAAEGPPDSEDKSDTPLKSRTCADCNKSFCRSYHLTICTDATDDDISATCFQRDSAKDEAVVFIFIFATVGLLVWAAVKPWVMRWREGAQQRHTYSAVGGGRGEGQ